MYNVCTQYTVQVHCTTFFLFVRGGLLDYKLRILSVNIPHQNLLTTEVHNMAIPVLFYWNDVNVILTTLMLGTAAQLAANQNEAPLMQNPLRCSLHSR